MLNHLKSEANIAYTENGAVTNASTMSDCLDLFAGIGALRAADDQEIIRRFVRAYAEDADIAMKILFFGRDVRGGLGERRVFRVIIHWLAENRAESLRKNIELIPEFGRYDDLVSLIGTACEKDALRTIRKQLEADLASDAEVSLLAKWLPSVNASNAETVRKAPRPLSWNVRCGVSQDPCRTEKENPHHRESSPREGLLFRLCEAAVQGHVQIPESIPAE